MSRLIDPLLRPSSIALIGASAKPGKIGNIVMRNLTAGGHRLYAVNPNEEEILGRRCYGSISEIPNSVDMAVIVLPSHKSVEATRDCALKGVGVVVVSSSGFAESGEDGRRLESALLEAVNGTDTRILGPNTMGVYVPSASLDTLFISPERGPRPRAGGVAMISQSGAVAVSFLGMAEETGLGVSACVCVGNKCDINELELIEHFGNDPETRCISMYLESFSDGRRFVELSREVSLKKPMVILKSGRTQAGARAANSHTGAVAASSDLAVKGALRQAGVARASEEVSLIDMSKAFSLADHIRGGRICVVASAGGFGVIATDLIESENSAPSLRMARLSKETKSALEEILPSFTSVQNPVDLTAEVSDQMYDEVLGALQTDPGVDAIMMSLELQPPNVTRQLVKIAAERSSGQIPIIASVFARDATSVLREATVTGLVAVPTLDRCVRLLNALAERGLRLRREN
ncbi:MAG: CoA-binding protein [Methanobacteriota archaeon]|nr:MAG: CoA-binding protein [Euryarchaeota archaeon]